MKNVIFCPLSIIGSLASWHRPTSLSQGFFYLHTWQEFDLNPASKRRKAFIFHIFNRIPEKLRNNGCFFAESWSSFETNRINILDRIGNFFFIFLRRQASPGPVPGPWITLSTPPPWTPDPACVKAPPIPLESCTRVWFQKLVFASLNESVYAKQQQVAPQEGGTVPPEPPRGSAHTSLFTNLFNWLKTLFLFLVLSRIMTRMEKQQFFEWKTIV